MYTGEILSLHNQGFTAGFIAHRLCVATGYVRAVVSSQLALNESPQCEVKPVYVETTTTSGARHGGQTQSSTEGQSRG